MSHLGAYQLGPGDPMQRAGLGWAVRFHVERNADDHLTHPGRPAAHLRCFECGQSVACLAPDLDNTGSYAMTVQVILSGVLSHLKVSHEDALPAT